MVVDELLPRLARAGLRAEPRDRVALMGYSMGGYGALLLASQLGKARVAAVVAESPALWTSSADAARRGLRRRRRLPPQRRLRPARALAAIPVKIDCGLADPFYRAAKEFADGLTPARPDPSAAATTTTATGARSRRPPSSSSAGRSPAAPDAGFPPRRITPEPVGRRSTSHPGIPVLVGELQRFVPHGTGPNAGPAFDDELFVNVL